MKVLPLLFFLSIVYSLDETTDRLKNISYKYEKEAKGNPEFSKWIEKINLALENDNSREKAKALREFQQYDKKRLHLEELITARIDEIDSFLPDRTLSQACVNDYENKKNVLLKANKLSLKEKKKSLDANSGICSEKDDTKDTATDAPKNATKDATKNATTNATKNPSSISSVNINNNTAVTSNSTNSLTDKMKEFGKKFIGKLTGK